MLNRFMFWAYNLTPAFWECVGIISLVVFITFTVGVN